MVTNKDRLSYALDSAMDNLEFALDAASIDFEVTTSPNTNQYIVSSLRGSGLPMSPPNSRGTVSPRF